MHWIDGVKAAMKQAEFDRDNALKISRASHEQWERADKRCQEQAAQIERLREALREIAGEVGPFSMPWPETVEGYGPFVVVRARTALAPAKEGE